MPQLKSFDKACPRLRWPQDRLGGTQGWMRKDSASKAVTESREGVPVIGRLPEDCCSLAAFIHFALQLGLGGNCPPRMQHGLHVLGQFDFESLGQDEPVD